jgi:glutamine cyclotransferase
VWYKDYIVAVNPQTGAVVAVDDLTKLLPKRDKTGKEDCFNGIALDSATDDIYFTGKWWPKVFRTSRKGLFVPT